jgi:hypothetical protein
MMEDILDWPGMNIDEKWRYWLECILEQHDLGNDEYKNVLLNGGFDDFEAMMDFGADLMRRHAEAGGLKNESPLPGGSGRGR